MATATYNPSSTTPQSTPHDTMKTIAPHAEPSPPPSPRSEHRGATSKPSGTTSRFFSHLKSIPIFADTSDFVSTHSPRFLTTTLTTAQNLTKSLTPTYILNRADRLGDAFLTQLEHSLPIMKTPTKNLTFYPKALYEKLIAQPITFLSTATNIYKNAGKERIGIAKENLLGTYKTHVEPLIGEYTNERIRHINNRFEGAVENGMPKSYCEALVEKNSHGESAARNHGEEIELYRSTRLARNALARGRVKFWVPMRNTAKRTCEDVKDGGETIKSEVRNVPGRMRDGAFYMWRVADEETQREREEGDGRVKGAAKVVYRVGERCAGEVVGVGLVTVAKGAGLLWGMWGLGKEKVKMA